MSIRVSIAILVVFAGLAVACAETAQQPATPVPAPAEAPTVQGTTIPAETQATSQAETPTAEPASTPTETPRSASTTTPQQSAASPSPGETTSGQTVDLGSGSPAPPLDLTLLDGGSLRLADLKGKVVVLNFWASWCVPCRWEMPAFEAIWREYQDQGVVFVGVAVSDMEENARAFAEEVGVTYPLGFDVTEQAARDYRVVSLPTTFLIDRQGNETRRIGVANEGVLRVFLKGLLRDQ